MKPPTRTKKTPKPKARKKPAKRRPGTPYRKGIDDNPTDTRPDPWGTPPPP